jgi:hypothetical protein
MVANGANMCPYPWEESMRGICYEARTRGREAVLLTADEMLIGGGARRWHKQVLAVRGSLLCRLCRR